jgi:hypothetical protein
MWRFLAGTMLGVVMFGTAVPVAEAGERTRVLHMSAALRHRLGRIFARDFNPHGFKYRVDAPGAKYGRVARDYYAIVAIYYRDSPVQNTDAGTVFVKHGRTGIWRIRQSDGGFDCAVVPYSLLVAWRMPRARCV